MSRREASGSVLDAVTADQIEVPAGLAGRPPIDLGPPPGDDPAPGSPSPWRGTPVSNARLGMAVFLSFEAMFFAGLIGAFLVFRLGSQVWPPAGQPRLPILVTSINTVILLISGYTMVAARRAARTGEWRGALPALSATAVLGGIFLSVQGSEWVRLIEHGLTLSAGVYGATFYTLIGCHALHVLGAVIWLLVVRFRAAGGALLRGRDTGFELCAAYWYFVVALWLVLFPLVYLF